MTRRWFMRVGVVSFLMVASAVNATDYVQRDLTCPREISIRPDFVSRIGSDPTFEEGGASGYGVRVDNPRINRDGQKLTCSYRMTGLLTGTPVYEYTAKRKIIECKRISDNRLQCRLEP